MNPTSKEVSTVNQETRDMRQYKAAQTRTRWRYFSRMSVPILTSATAIAMVLDENPWQAAVVASALAISWGISSARK